MSPDRFAFPAETSRTLTFQYLPPITSTVYPYDPSYRTITVDLIPKPRRQSSDPLLKQLLRLRVILNQAVQHLFEHRLLTFT